MKNEIPSKNQRLLSMYELLDDAINSKNLRTDEDVVFVRISVMDLRRILKIPENLGFTDAKRRYLIPLFNDINAHSELCLSFVEDRIGARTINYVSLELRSTTLTPSKLLSQITKFKKNGRL